MLSLFYHEIMSDLTANFIGPFLILILFLHKHSNISIHTEPLCYACLPLWCQKGSDFFQFVPLRLTAIRHQTSHKSIPDTLRFRFILLMDDGLAGSGG